MKRFFAALLLFGWISSAWAQSSVPTPNQDARVPLFVSACIDAQGRALLPGSATCVPMTQPVSGTVTSNQGAPNGGGTQAWWVQWSGMSVAVSAIPSIPAGSNVIGGVTQSGAWTVGQGAPGAAAWKVDGSGVTQPVSSAGTFPVQNTAPVVGGNSAAVKTDGSATTQPVSAASLPLPAGAAQENGGNLATLVARTPPLVNGASPVATPTPAAIVTGQVKIATTGTAVQLPTAALQNGILVKAKSTNAAQTASYSAAVGSSTVTTVFDGTGTGYALAPGEAASFATSNASAVYVNGTAGDVFTYEGN